MPAHRRGEAWDTVCKRRADQAYVDPAIVQPLSVTLKKFRLSNLRSSNLDSKSADIESGEERTQSMASKPLKWRHVRNPFHLVRIGVIATAQIRFFSRTFDLS